MLVSATHILLGCSEGCSEVQSVDAVHAANFARWRRLKDQFEQSYMALTALENV